MRVIVVGLILNLQVQLLEHLVIDFGIVKMIEWNGSCVQFELVPKLALHVIQIDGRFVDRHLGHKKRNGILQEFKPVVSLENGIRKMETR